MHAEWPCTLLAERRFHTLAPILATLNSHTFPDHAALNRLSERCSVRNAKAMPLRFEAKNVQSYEQAVYETSIVPTRPDNWHDLFNALAWCAFPRTKALLNRLHIEELAKQRGEVRSKARDVLTLFDESGMIVLCAEPELKALLQGFRWKELFWQRRAAARRSMRFYIFGHALHEQLLRPYAGITAKAVILDASAGRLALEGREALAFLDESVCKYFEQGEALQSARNFQPVPVLGIPDWWPPNEQENYYDDTRYFRSGRRIKQSPM